MSPHQMPPSSRGGKQHTPPTHPWLSFTQVSDRLKPCPRGSNDGAGGVLALEDVGAT